MTDFNAILAEASLHEFAEWFFRKYAPQDAYEASQFHADLFTLLDRVRVDAQEPLIKRMADAMALVPPPTIILPKEKAA